MRIADLPTRRLALLAGALTIGVTVGACSGGKDSAAPASSAPVIAAGTGAGIALMRTELTAAEQDRAHAAAEALLAQLVADHPQLGTATVATPVPVYEQTAPEPVGAMVEIAVPTPIATIDLDLLRIKADKPDPVPSRITNLSALELIYLFRTDEIVYLGVEPGSREALSPDKATSVEPLHPDRSTDTDFGDTD